MSVKYRVIPSVWRVLPTKVPLVSMPNARGGHRLLERGLWYDPGAVPFSFTSMNQSFSYRAVAMHLPSPIHVCINARHEKLVGDVVGL